jgi:ankyrin repeat protein
MLTVFQRDLLGYTPLHYASLAGSKEICLLLMKHHNIRTDIKNNNGKTPIALAKNKDVATIIKDFKGINQRH